MYSKYEREARVGSSHWRCTRSSYNNMLESVIDSTCKLKGCTSIKKENTFEIYFCMCDQKKSPLTHTHTHTSSWHSAEWVTWFFTLYTIIWLNDSSPGRRERAKKSDPGIEAVTLRQAALHKACLTSSLISLFYTSITPLTLSLYPLICSLSLSPPSPLVSSSLFSLTGSTGWEYLWELRPGCKEHSRSGICQSWHFPSQLH